MPEILSTTDFDLPVTEEFLNRVQRGVRRRRAFRLAAAGCAVLAVTGGVFAVTRPHESALPIPAASFGPSTATGGFVDRFRIGYIPEGIVLGPELGSDNVPITADGNEATAGHTTGPDDPVVVKSTRRFEQPNGGSYLWITVFRQLPAPVGQGSPILMNALMNRYLDGTVTVGTFDVPAGKAHLTRTSGTEHTAYGMVIACPDLSVIAIETNARVPADELKAVAAGLVLS
jgi:hypothetical protein